MGRTVFLKQGVSGEMYSKGIYSFEEFMGSKQSVPPRMPKRMDRQRTRRDRQAIDTTWRKNFEKYKSDPTGKWSLGWIELQAIVKNSGKLNQEKINEFLSIGVVLAEPIHTTRNWAWFASLSKLKSDPASPKSQAFWDAQITMNNRDTLSQEKIGALEAAGFFLPCYLHTGRIREWNASFERLKLVMKCLPYKAQPSEFSNDLDERWAAKWIKLQAYLHKTGTLLKYRATLLAKAGVDLSGKNNEEHRKRHDVSYWAQAHKDFVALNGAPPHHKTGSEGKLYMACRNLRCKHLSGKLSTEEAAVLAGAGVI